MSKKEAKPIQVPLPFQLSKKVWITTVKHRFSFSLSAR